MEASVRNFGVGFLGGGASQLLPGYIGELGKAASGLLQTIGITTMAMSTDTAIMIAIIMAAATIICGPPMSMSWPTR